MEIINRRKRIASLTRKLRREDKIIGFVATMGALHKGHLSLVKKARQICDTVIVSVFVNPVQFNENEDFINYPRDLAIDAALLAKNDVDYVFAPDADEMYGENFSTFVTVDDISDKLEGASRPGHFRGVATIVAMLFTIIKPHFAIFGQKDAQQIAVIKRMVANLGFETEIVVIPIVREKTGLAMSSRNERLDNNERQAASVLYRSLTGAKTAVEGGEQSASRIAEIVRNEIETEPLADIDYIAVVDETTLEPIVRVDKNNVLVVVAARFGKIRLIDNILLRGRR